MFNTKTCRECGVRFHKDFGQEIEGEGWYCGQHQKPYDLVYYHESGRPVYERIVEVRVTDGVPVGYVTEAMYLEGGRHADSRYRSLQEIAEELRGNLEAAEASAKSFQSIKKMDEQYIKYLEGQLGEYQAAEKTKVKTTKKRKG